MSLKTEEPTVNVLDLFPKDADTKPKVGEIQPSDFFKFEADMNSALSKIAPIDANVPRRLGMRQLFAEETEWKALAEPIKDNSKKEILCRLIVVTLLPRRKAVSEQQREEKQSKVSNFSHKALV